MSAILDALRSGEHGLQQMTSPALADNFTLLDALPAAIYTTDAAGRITYFNDAAAELWGCRPEIGKNEWCGSWKLFWVDGTPLPHDECPMAIALKEKRPIRGIEAIAERPDGTRVHFIPYPTPLFDRSGALTGAINMLVDITQHRRTARDSQTLAAIVTHSDDAIFSKNLDGIVLSWNRGAERLFGYSPEEIVGRTGLVLIPPDHHDEEPEILGRIRRGEHVDHYETVRQRKDGSLMDISLTVSPIHDANGKIVGASKIARDITERRRAQEQQTLLLREMSHRVKNLFAVAGSLVSLSARTARTSEEMAAAVRDRLAALTRAHDLTRPGLLGTKFETGQATTLHQLVRTIFAPYANGEMGRSDRVILNGADVRVGVNAVTNLALLLHELATNAAKYGALSSGSGAVTIDCEMQDADVVISWREQGGPVIEGEPGTEGFGGVLLQRIVTTHFNGQLTREWLRDGLVVRLTLPHSRLTD